MITIEKLLFLKSVHLFKEMPDDLLLEVASTLAHEKRVGANQCILEKGTINSTMYVITSGTVKVHDEDGNFIKQLGDREIFGELSALTGKPTVSSVSTVTECLFLTIRKDALYDLMRVETALSKGIILALCERAQDMSFQIQNLIN